MTLRIITSIGVKQHKAIRIVPIIAAYNPFLDGFAICSFIFFVSIKSGAQRILS
jgi:hypothetical protein